MERRYNSRDDVASEICNVRKMLKDLELMGSKDKELDRSREVSMIYHCSDIYLIWLEGYMEDIEQLIEDYDQSRIEYSESNLAELRSIYDGYVHEFKTKYLDRRKL